MFSLLHMEPILLSTLRPSGALETVPPLAESVCCPSLGFLPAPSLFWTLPPIVIDSGKFDWIGSGKFPSFTEPHPGFHGLQFAQHFGASVFAAKVRLDVLRDLGTCLSPLSAFQMILGRESSGPSICC